MRAPTPVNAGSAPPCESRRPRTASAPSARAPGRSSWRPSAGRFHQPSPRYQGAMSRPRRGVAVPDDYDRQDAAGRVEATADHARALLARDVAPAQMIALSRPTTRHATLFAVPFPESWSTSLPGRLPLLLRDRALLCVLADEDRRRFVGATKAPPPSPKSPPDARTWRTSLSTIEPEQPAAQRPGAPVFITAARGCPRAGPCRGNRQARLARPIPASKPFRTPQTGDGTGSPRPAGRRGRATGSPRVPGADERRVELDRVMWPCTRRTREVRGCERVLAANPPCF